MGANKNMEVTHEDIQSVGEVLIEQNTDSQGAEKVSRDAMINKVK